jgi:hypothetical protein
VGAYLLPLHTRGILCWGLPVGGYITPHQPLLTAQLWVRVMFEKEWTKNKNFSRLAYFYKHYS